ncbi:hypothetical protein ACSBR2_031105 [Camellia fascicularis]
MSTKRSLVVRSSSSGELGVMNQYRPMESPPAALLMKKRATGVVAPPTVRKKLAQKDNSNVRVIVPEQTHRNIFTLGSPARDDESQKRVDERYWVFLQSCFHCKQRISEDEDVFMYGYLQAFCSPKCRDIQIALDGKNGIPSPIPTVAATKVMKEEPAKRVFGSQVSKYTISKFK